MNRDEALFLVRELADRLKENPGTTLGHWGPAQKAVALPAIQEPTPDLNHLRDDVIGDCRLCPLGNTRTRLVFGVGNPQARVMFVGEGPGYMEDREGEPFVGPAGQLLDKILASVGLSRRKQDPDWSWVYIANMVKCHPMVDSAHPDKRSNDRPPNDEEMARCRPFLMEQIRLIRPAFVVALGATAARALLKTTRGISSLRGQWTDFAPDGGGDFSLRLLPTYHPAALLRNPALKKDVWGDMKNLRDHLHGSVEKE
jgi:DNA polymerase